MAVFLATVRSTSNWARSSCAGRQWVAVGAAWHAVLVTSTSAFGKTVLIVGPESLLAERAVNALLRQATREDATVGVRRLDAAGLNRGSLAEACGGSLFASASAVVVEQLAECPADLFDDLVALAEQPIPELCLALVHNGGAKGKGLVDRLRKAGVDVVECPAIKTWELPQFVSLEVRRGGGSIDLATAAFLVEAVGSDLRTLAAAVAQLLADQTGGQSVTEATVRRYFGGRAEVTSFSVADDTMQGNVEGALGKLRWAVSTGVAPVLVTSALAGSLRNLGRYLDVRDARQRDGDLARTLGVPPWKIKDLARQSRDWSPAGVARALQAVAVADAQVKGAAGDAGFALEQVVLKVIACRGR